MRIRLTLACVTVLFLAAAQSVFAAESEVDMLLNMLTKKGVITVEDAATFRAEVAMKKQEEVAAKPKQAAGPAEWAERIKLGGDVRFRTRGDWGKTSNATNANTISKQRLQESVRPRFFLEAKVNDITYAGGRVVGGDNSRSADITLNGYFNKATVYFDQYYIRFEAPKAWAIKYGQYYSEMKLWTGKFQNPFEVSEMMWDPDITTGGIAFQYVSPDIKTGFLPDISLYSNLGMFWLDESASSNTDPILWGYQTGVKTVKFGAFGSIVNLAATFYNFANLQHKTPNANSAGTNSRVWRGDMGGMQVSASNPLLGTYRYEYNVFDLLWRIDNEKIMDWDFPHGFYGDFAYNASCPEDGLNKGVQAGAYIGKNKLKDNGDWKARLEWRYLERDSVPDFLPDSNFYGFGTYTSINSPPGTNGYPAGGGTNGKGIKAMFEYQLFKSTILNFSYYWMKPIKAYDKRDPYNQFLFDVIVKF